jgi:hypothetical protein
MSFNFSAPPNLDINTQDLLLGGPVLTQPHDASQSRAGSALRSYARVSEQLKTFRDTIRLPFDAIQNYSHFYEKPSCIPQALISVQDRKTDGAAIILSVFEDLSCLVWRQDIKAKDACFELYPFVLKMTKKIHPVASTPGTFVFTKGRKKHEGYLSFKQTKRKEWRLNGSIDVHTLPLQTGVVYVKLIAEAVAWSHKIKDLPNIYLKGTKDWTSTGFMPPALAYTPLSEETLSNIETHLKKAADLIHLHLCNSVYAWEAYVQTRTREQTGKLSPIHFTINAYNEKRVKDKDLCIRIERAFIAALKHQKCPVPFSDIQGRTLVWGYKNKKICKDYTEVTGQKLWSGWYEQKPLPAHRLMGAAAHFGGAQTLFPTGNNF